MTSRYLAGSLLRHPCTLGDSRLLIPTHSRVVRLVTESDIAERKGVLAAGTSLTRPGRPEAVGSASLMLIALQSSDLTGPAVAVDGGSSAR